MRAIRVLRRSEATRSKLVAILDELEVGPEDFFVVCAQRTLLDKAGLTGKATDGRKLEDLTDDELEAAGLTEAEDPRQAEVWDYTDGGS